MVVYISGAITNNPNYELDFKIREAHLHQMGYRVVNPVKIGKKLESTFYEKPKWEDYMKVCLQELLRCDGISMLDGWEKSKGAAMEHDIAVKLGMQIVEVKLLNPRW